MRVVLASKNAHKLEEISKITEKFGIELILQSELGVDLDVEENGTTFEENSLIKAKAVMEATGLPALADDSGLSVDALHGEPGIYSARYGFDESLDDRGRLNLLLKNMAHIPNGSRQVCQASMMLNARHSSTHLPADATSPSASPSDIRISTMTIWKMQIPSSMHTELLLI